MTKIDATFELQKILSEELAKEIDREILKGLGIEVKDRGQKIKELLDDDQ